MRLKQSLISAEAEVVIPFNDVDMMRVAWHGNYFKYIEDARCALLDKIHYNYGEMEASGYMWPIVDTRVKYIKPARFKQRICIQAHLTEYQNRLKIEYIISDAESGQRLSKAYSIQVAVDMVTEEMCFCSPQILIDQVEAVLNASKQQDGQSDV